MRPLRAGEGGIGAQERGEGAGDREDAHHVDFHLLAKIRHALDEEGVAEGGAGIVDQAIQGAAGQGGAHLIGGGDDGVIVLHIEEEGGEGLAQLLFQRGGVGLAAHGAEDMPAFGRP